MGSNMEIFEARVLGENLSFWFEKSPILRIDYNDTYKPHANNYSNLSMFTKVIA
jgi:hypothetical protein